MTINIPSNICAIDASTNSLAFAMFTTEKTKFGQTLGTIGKINFEGNNIYEKIIDAAKKSKALFDFYKPEEAF